MGAKVNYTLVGLFVVVLGSSVVATTIWLSSLSTQKSYEIYEVYVYESVAGLNPGAPVKYRGVDVGQVRSIDLDRINPERVKLLLNIEEGTPIKTDTEAVLSRQGLTGIAYVDLAGGSAQAPALTAAAGERYPRIPAGQSLLLRIDTAVSASQAELFEVTNEVKNVLRNLNAFLVEENQRAIADTLKNIRDLSESLVKQTALLERNLRRLTPTIDHLNETTKEFPALVRQANQRLPELAEAAHSGFTAIRDAAQSINRTANHFDGFVVDAQEEFSRLSSNTLAQTSPLIIEMQQLSVSLRRLAQHLEQNPDQIIFGRPQRVPGPGE
ncbi:MAG: MlaD family protein [Gammaproteobacteria bacterium]